MSDLAFDDRLPLQRWRRTKLFALAAQERVQITEQETKDQLLMKLQGSGIDPAKPPKLETDPAITGEDGPTPRVDFSGLNFFQLRKLCTERGITWEKTDKRTDLLAKLDA
jgi:hypothetical protein